MEHSNIKRFLFAAAVLAQDVLIGVCEGNVTSIGSSVSTYFGILGETDDACSLLRVLSLLRLKLFTYLPLLSSHHLDVLQTYPELGRWLRWRWLLGLDLTLWFIWTVVWIRLCSILLASLSFIGTWLVDFALLKNRNGWITDCWEPLYRVGDNVPLVLAYAALVVAFLVCCWLNWDFLYDFETLYWRATALLALDKSWHITPLDAWYGCCSLLFLGFTDTFGGLWVWVLINEHLGLDRARLLTWRIIAQLTLTVFVWAEFWFFIFDFVDNIGGKVRLTCLDAWLRSICGRFRWESHWGW